MSCHEFNDSPIHLTNHIPDAPDIHEFLCMM
jgi:hypothetical protein